MIVKLKEKNLDYPDLTPDQLYFVIGIEADDYRILNDFGKPYLYPPQLFEVVEPREPSIWFTEYGEDGERYSYPPELNEAGFFEDYFERKRGAISRFWHVINARLLEVSSDVSKASQISKLQVEKINKLLETAAEIVQAQAAVEPMSSKQISSYLIETFSTLRRMQRAEEQGHYPDIDSAEEVSVESVKVAKKEPRQSIQGEKIFCLECGIQLRQLTTRHLASHNLTPREYKKEWGFSLKQPLSAKSLTETRSKAAKMRGLPANLAKFLEERVQNKVEAAAASQYAAKQKLGKPTVKRRPKGRKTA